MRKTTIHDIAQELNITAATVSRALNNNPEISAQTKLRVQQAAKRLNYNPNKLASSLRSGKTHVIGVMIPTAEHPFFGSVVHGFSNAASENGYDVLIYQSNEAYSYEVAGIKTFMNARVDGIVASLSKQTAQFDHFLEAEKRGIPVVLFDRVNESLKLPSVVIDDYRGGYMATEHLIQQGFRRIAHISGPPYIKAFADRLNGYRAALAAYQLPFDPALVFQGNISIDSGREGIRSFLALSEWPDAVFTVEDFTALGVLKELKERSIAVPEQMGLMGFSNELFSEHTTPALSTVDQQTVLMGQETFSLLHRIMEKNVSNSLKIVLDPILLIRESSIRNV